MIVIDLHIYVNDLRKHITKEMVCVSKDDDEREDEYEDERENERGEEWKEYKESMKEWKDQYKEILHDWKDRIRDWKDQIEEKAASGSVFHFDFPPVPPVPPMPPMHSTSTGRANVVASRIGDEDIRLIDMLIEAGVFSTRSEAVAYLVNEGIKARRDTFEKVSTSLEEIRKTRKEAERQVGKLKEEIGLKESNETAEQDRKCPKCGKQMPEGSCSFCPYCGTSLEKK
jgi:Arc/MetJ-type ribon-helix-helix transcriptional regulator